MFRQNVWLYLKPANFDSIILYSILCILD